jgi:inorganic pyrophosphatase
LFTRIRISWNTKTALYALVASPEVGQSGFLSGQGTRCIPIPPVTSEDDRHSGAAGHAISATNLLDDARIHCTREVGGEMSQKNGLADPTRLKSFVLHDKQLLRVVVETPKGSRNKFAFNPDEHVFELKKVLPSGMTFPYDFGFVPSTQADDGDPVDVLVLMDEPAFPGCVLSCRAIGVIEGEQGNKKKDKERNDRIIAIEQDAHSWEDIKTVNDLGKQFARELEEFFVNYHRLSGKQYRVLGLKGPDQARKLVKSGKRWGAPTDGGDSYAASRGRCGRFGIRSDGRDMLKPKSFAGLFGVAPL